MCVVNVEWPGGNHRASVVCPPGITDETNSRHQEDVFRQFCFISLLYLLIYIMCVIFSILFGKAQCKIPFTKICVNSPSFFRNTCLQQYKHLDCTWICLLCEGYSQWRGGTICWGGVQTWRDEFPFFCAWCTPVDLNIRATTQMTGPQTSEPGHKLLPMGGKKNLKLLITWN